MLGYHLRVDIEGDSYLDVSPAAPAIVKSGPRVVGIVGLMYCRVSEEFGCEAGNEVLVKTKVYCAILLRVLLTEADIKPDKSVSVTLFITALGLLCG